MAKYSDLQADGFEEVVEKPKKVHPKKEVAPYVVVDNTEVLHEINRSNKAIHQSNDMMKNALTNLVGKMKVKPVSMELDIIRDDNGFMQKVNVMFRY